MGADIVPSFSRFVIPSDLFADGLSSVVAVQVSVIVALLRFQLSLLFFILFCEVVSIFARYVRPRAGVTMFSCAMACTGLSICSGPSLSLSVVHRTVRLRHLCVAILRREVLHPSQCPQWSCTTRSCFHEFVVFSVFSTWIGGKLRLFYGVFPLVVGRVRVSF